MQLADVKALVTGGGSGIGLAIATALVDAGGKVVICGRNAEKLEKAAERSGATAIAADVSIEETAPTLIPRVVETLGGYNVLINNAGIGDFAGLLDTSNESFTNVWRVNVLGAMMVARESARHFVGQDYGHIVNIASTAGRKGFGGGTAYVASKFALSGMTECWRAELRKHNIRVMQVNPSEVITDFFESNGLGAQQPDPTKIHAEDIARVVSGMLALDDRAFITETSVWATNPSS